VRYVREAMFTTARLGGFLAVVGESGAGKTVLRRDLIDRVQREGHPIRIIQPRALDKVTLTARHICEAILEDLRPGTRHATSLERLARQVEQLLLDSSRAGNQHLLLIEEAHDLHISTLKYLKRFWELEDGFKKLLAIVLVGQPELKQRLDERINFDAREVIRRCEIAELQPLNNNLETYLAHKLRRVGAEIDQVLDESAFTAIRNRLTVQRGGGRAQMLSLLYPLVVNNLVTRALNAAAEIGAPRVTADVIAEL
jgi:type II secretory pathway predicted ATPase ExeA